MRPILGQHGRVSVRILLASVVLVLASVASSFEAQSSASSSSAVLLAGESLVAGQSLTSANGAYVLSLGEHGNLVLRWLGQVTWRVSSRPGSQLTLSHGGNLQLLKGASVSWATNTKGHKDPGLWLQDDGNLVLYAKAGPYWAAGTATPTVALSSKPAYNGDAPDPMVIRYQGKYWALTTGTAVGNHLQVLRAESPLGPYAPFPTGSYGASALPNVPSWQTMDTQTSPGAYFYANHFIMFYNAAVSPHPAATGYNCVSVASAAAAKFPVFTDRSSTCVIGPTVPGAAAQGILDPHPYVDPATHQAFLVFKSNDGCDCANPELPGVSPASQVWSVPLDATGMKPIAGLSPSLLATVNQGEMPWETTFDNPQLINSPSGLTLLFSPGLWTDGTYKTATMHCFSPTLCHNPPATVILSGPMGAGGGAIFSDGPYTFLAYANGGNSTPGQPRKLFVSPIHLP